MAAAGTEVECRGAWLFSSGQASKEGYRLVVVFLSREKLPTGEMHFGFDVDELPKRYQSASLREFKGVRGVLGGTENVSQGSSGDVTVRMLTHVTPLF